MLSPFGSPEVHDHLLGLGCVDVQIVIVTPSTQMQDFLSVG